MGQRFPSAEILRKIAKPLGFSESDLLASGGYPSFLLATEGSSPGDGRLDPYVAAIASEVQRAIDAIRSMLKNLARGNDSNIGFREYAHRKYPELDEDLIIMIEDIIEREVKGREVIGVVEDE